MLSSGVPTSSIVNVNPVGAFDRQKCLKLYESAVEADSWGQHEEALEAYGKLVLELTHAIKSVDASMGSARSDKLQFNSTDESIIVKLVTSLKIRQRELQADATLGVDLKGIKQIRAALEEIGSGRENISFPLIMHQTATTWQTLLRLVWHCRHLPPEQLYPSSH